MYSALLRKLKKKEKIKDSSIQFYIENRELKVLINKTTHIIKDNNMLVSLTNKNYKILKAADAAL